jgi:hypothetical protein
VLQLLECGVDGTGTALAGGFATPSRADPVPAAPLLAGDDCPPALEAELGRHLRLGTAGVFALGRARRGMR